jgi:hypothetical protein
MQVCDKILARSNVSFPIYTIPVVYTFNPDYEHFPVAVHHFRYRMYVIKYHCEHNETNFELIRQLLRKLGYICYFTVTLFHIRALHKF